MANTLLYMYTPQQTLTSRVLCSLPSVPLQGNAYALPRVPRVRISASRFFKQPICLIRVRIIPGMIYLHRKEVSQSTCILGIGIGELATKRPQPHRCNRISFVAKNGKCIRRQHLRAYVDDSVACAVPTGHHINTDKSHLTALLSCPR